MICVNTILEVLEEKKLVNILEIIIVIFWQRIWLPLPLFSKISACGYVEELGINGFPGGCLRQMSIDFVVIRGHLNTDI